MPARAKGERWLATMAGKCLIRSQSCSEKSIRWRPLRLLHDTDHRRRWWVDADAGECALACSRAPSVTDVIWGPGLRAAHEFIRGALTLCAGAAPQRHEHASTRRLQYYSMRCILQQGWVCWDEGNAMEDGDDGAGSRCRVCVVDGAEGEAKGKGTACWPMGPAGGLGGTVFWKVLYFLYSVQNTGYNDVAQRSAYCRFPAIIARN